jgi:hypothetical protein
VAAEKPIQKLLQSEMSRREFLGFMGAATLAVVGVSGILRSLNSLTGSRTDQGQDGYGASSYGGKRRSSSQTVL